MSTVFKIKKAAQMKVGFVFECQDQGPDELVYTYIAKELCKHFEILQENISPLGNKHAVINDSALDVETMFANKCDYVFIMWDRMPKWKHGTGKCDDDKATLTKNLTAAGVDMTKVIMCCIDEMLESWLIADGRGVTNYFQGLNHQSPKFDDHKTKAEQASPKEKLSIYNGRYNEYKDNLGIVKGLGGDYSRAVKWNTSFGEFVDAVNRICPQAV
ncbi:MAG: hypothetical protein K2X37_02320 [Chitinophagaceae bacterium]|nr:hypothetical protein [Chitinophagaceae bacterium]